MSPYHHGHLRTALVDAALELARAHGPEAVVLREVSRRVGVSHNAAYRHFPDRDRLLKAVCGRCMSALATLMERGIAHVPADSAPLTVARARLRATGEAYVTFALTEPGWFRTAFAVPPGMNYLDEHEGEGRSGRDPYEILSAALDELAAAGGLAPDRRPHAETAAWSAVHGLSVLLIDGPLRDLPEPERLLARDRVLETVEWGRL